MNRTARTVVTYPDYPDATKRRIEKARENAHTIPRKAWYVGRSPYTGALQFQVGSAVDNTIYYPGVYRDASWGGFVYSKPGVGPCVWIVCTCMAASNNAPCKHAARVAHRLERAAARCKSGKPKTTDIEQEVTQSC